MARVMANRRIEGKASDYAGQVVDRLGGVLGDGLEAVYLIGSLALDDYVPGRSDIDILAVCANDLPVHTKRAVVDVLSHPNLYCPTRGLEFVLYEKTSAARITTAPRFEINLNTGPEMDQHVSFDPRSEPAHWFVLDIAIARQRAVALKGPPASDLFGAIPHEWILSSLLESLEWHAEHENLTPNTVLNACRSWRFAQERVFDSKSAAAAWACARMRDPSIIESALALRSGATSSTLDPEEVCSFVHSVRDRIVDAEIDSLRHRTSCPPSTAPDISTSRRSIVRCLGFKAAPANV